MRIALVCDWLTEKGGAEKVLLELHKMYPEAPIYTSQYRPKRIDWFKDAKVKAGWLNIFPASFRKILGPLRQSYFSHLDLSDYDLIISVTGAEAKGIKLRTRKYDSDSRPGQYEVVLPPQDDPIHICYCHAPTQYYWQKYDEYLENPGFGKLNSIVRFFFKLFVKPLRRADYRAATRPDQFITISNDSADAIAEYYQRDSIIVAPPVEIEKFSTTFPQISSNSPQDQSKNPQNTESNPQEIHNGRELFHKKSTTAGNFSTRNPQDNTSFPQAKHLAHLKDSFVIACRQVTWKRIDLAISACIEAEQPLIVIGDGPEHQSLVELAAGSPFVQFVPWLTSDSLATYLKSARAFLFPSHEPFGIAAVEALAAGCPVIAFAKGGSRDFIAEGKNGLLFEAQTVESLVSVLRNFDKHRWNRTEISKTANIFAADNFRSDIEKIVNALPINQSKKENNA